MIEIITTDTFDKWLKKQRNRQAVSIITQRIIKVSATNQFGDFKQITTQLFEMRFFIGKGYRVYYTKKGDTLVILLAGGTKDSQERDIKKAKDLIKNLE